MIADGTGSKNDRPKLAKKLANKWERYQAESEKEKNDCAFYGSIRHESVTFVIIYYEKVPRHLWRIGIITKLLTSKDGNCRGAEVKIGKTSSIIRRPVNKLYPLVPSSDDVNSDPYKADENVDIRDLKDRYSSEHIGSSANDASKQRRKAAIVGER